MKVRKAVALGALSAGLVLIPACGKAAEKVTKKATEKAIENQTGGKVDIGDSGVTFKDSDGEVNIGTSGKTPKNWPKVLALPKGAKVAASSSTADGSFLVYQSSLSPEKLIEHFSSALESDGWEQTSTANYGDLASISYQKDGATATVNASSGDSGGGSTGSITYAKATDSN